MRLLLTLIPYGFLLVGAVAGQAQSSQPLATIAGHDVSKPFFGVRYGSPQRWSGSLAIVVGEVDEVDRMPVAKGVILSGDLGEGGGKGSIGMTLLTPGRCLLGFYAHGVLFGAVAKASVLRTWGNPSAVEPGATYLGPELEIGAFFLNLTLGYLVRVNGPDSSRRDLFAWNAGIGF